RRPPGRAAAPARRGSSCSRARARPPPPGRPGRGRRSAARRSHAPPSPATRPPGAPRRRGSDGGSRAHRATCRTGLDGEAPAMHDEREIDLSTQARRPMTASARRVTATVTLTDDDGRPLARRDVTVRQRRHAFEFGCVGTHPGETDEHVQRAWLDVFDTATLPVYWGRYEPVRGEPRRAELEQAARWHADRGVRLKGH